MDISVTVILWARDLEINNSAASITPLFYHTSWSFVTSSDQAVVFKICILYSYLCTT